MSLQYRIHSLYPDQNLALTQNTERRVVTEVASNCNMVR